MPRVLKSTLVSIDEDNRVRISVPENSFSSPADESGADTEGRSDRRRENPVRAAQLVAGRVISDAEQEAGRIIDQARSEAESMKQRMLEGAYDDGYADGERRGYEDTEAMRLEAKRELAEAGRIRAGVLAETEKEIVGLIDGLLTKLTHNALKLQPELILALVRQGVSSIPASKRIQVRVAAGDYAAVTAGREDILAMIGGAPELEIVKDMSLREADCIIETEFGSIDCSLGSELEILRTNLYHLYNSQTDNSRSGNSQTGNSQSDNRQSDNKQPL